METPFSFGKIALKNSFTNRDDERIRLETNFKSGLNTTLISPRRWGKSSLVKETARIMEPDKSIRFCFIDLFKVQNEEEFFQAYLKAIIKSTSNKAEELLQNIKEYIGKFVPKIALSFDNNAEVKISFTQNDLQKDWEDILNLAEHIATQKGFRLVICVDEFQNIVNFSDPLALQKKLRSVWQHHQNATYCLYGSKRHMLIEMFQNTSMPFYNFGDIIFLNKIGSQYFVPFIEERFKSTHKEIETEAANQIVNMVENHPYHVQELAHFTWVITEKRATKETVQRAMQNLFTDNTILYYNIVENLSGAQINLLKAIIDGHTSLTGKKVVKDYNLSSSSNVIRAKKALELKEVIDNVESHIEFINPTFKLWFKNIYMKD